MQKKALRKGYTTGAHTYMAFRSALEAFLLTKKHSFTQTNKMDNDDLDVTKGCEIIVSVSDVLEDLELNALVHQPATYCSASNRLSLYAGVGVGVVTKKGLKIAPNFPAINPVPRDAIFQAFQEMTEGYEDVILHCSVSVTDGQRLAQETANAKVGVLGGISILGTTGIVKPISANAYLDSIEQELAFASTNGFTKVIFTLGNTAYKKAKESQEKHYIIEIGNFVYDGIALALQQKIENIELWLGIGKSVKVAQGLKNTHNRFGSIDFGWLQELVSIDIEGCNTVKRVRELHQEKSVQFDAMIQKKAEKQLQIWFHKDIKVKIC